MPASTSARRALLLLAVSSGGWAQEAPPLRVTTRLVQVNVVVERGPGAPARLTKNDFQLFDNGKPRSIELFVGASDAGSSAPARALPPRVYSNRYARPVAAASVVLFDVLNTPQARHAATKAQLIRSLAQMKTPGNVALYVLDSKLRVLHDFTDDPARLGETLARYKALDTAAVDLHPRSSGMTPNAATAGTPLGQMSADSDQSLAAFTQANRARITLAALEAIARHLRPIPGRKSLVWISSSFPLSVYSPGGTSRFDEEANRVARAMSEADVAIYPVANSGLATTPALNAEAGAGSTRGRPRAIPPIMGDSSSRTLAEGSGGVAYFNTNDLPAAVGRALADAQAGYTLGFYPPEDALDGKYHEIRVQVKQRGYTLRHRRGYLAAGDGGEAELESYLWSPFQSAAVGASVRVDPVDQPKPGSLRLLIGIDIATLTLAPKGDRRAGAVDLRVVEQAGDGAPLKTTGELISLDLTAAQHEQYLKDGLVLVKNIEPAAEARQMRILLQDRGSGKVGSVVIPGIPELRSGPLP